MAFNPTIEGFAAASTTGGAGGNTTEFTNLNDTGAGSFREALTLSRPRIIRPATNISGDITIQSGLSIGADVTIDWSTAANKGIQIRIGSSMTGGIFGGFGNNVIVTHVKIRPGNEGSGSSHDGIQIAGSGASNICIDHCSVYWCDDGTIDIVDGASNVTVQHCIIAENTGPGHMLVRASNTTGITVHHNFFLHGFSGRDPSMDGGVEFDVVGNVVYRNFDFPAAMSLAPKTANMFGNFVVNYIRNALNANSNLSLFTGSKAPFGATSEVYLQGNRSTSRPNDGLPESDFTSGDPLPIVGTRFSYPAVTTEATAELARDFVLANCGARVGGCLDPDDQRMIDDFNNSTGATPPTDGDPDVFANGWPNLVVACPGAPPPPSLTDTHTVSSM